ncbi:MAG: DUF1080 domain-containing protein [Planctomycetota bacterium]|nr:DUF1080 domain-containing protein [Planctomycetota bacterium]
MTGATVEPTIRHAREQPEGDNRNSELRLPAFPPGSSLWSPSMQAFVRRVVFTLCGLVIIAGWTTCRAEEPRPPAGFRALFNGKDLTGWFGLNPHNLTGLTGDKKEAKLAEERAEFAKHWRVENGELVNDGHGPYATTEVELGDIEFLIDYKTVAMADSGIYLRGLPQVQIWDWNQVYDLKNPTRKPHLGSGGLFNNTPGTSGRDPLLKADRPFGEWNQFRIRQVGDRTWAWLNDKLVVDDAPLENYSARGEPIPAKGPIHLQTHGGEIRWKNIFVRDIGPEGGPGKESPVGGRAGNACVVRRRA